MSNQTADTHAHEKTVEIIVNSRPKKVEPGEISYEQVINLAFDNNPPSGDGVLITVTYKKGHDEGSLTAGRSVPVENGMKFDVSATNKS